MCGGSEQSAAEQLRKSFSSLHRSEGAQGAGHALRSFPHSLEHWRHAPAAVLPSAAVSAPRTLHPSLSLTSHPGPARVTTTGCGPSPILGRRVMHAACVVMRTRACRQPCERSKEGVSTAAAGGGGLGAPAQGRWPAAPPPAAVASWGVSPLRILRQTLLPPAGAGLQQCNILVLGPTIQQQLQLGNAAGADQQQAPGAWHVCSRHAVLTWCCC
jgi:hypothetical protein